MGYDRVISQIEIENVKKEVGNFVKEAVQFIKTTETPIQQLKGYCSKYNVSSSHIRTGNWSVANLTNSLHDNMKAMNTSLDETAKEYIQIESTSTRILDRAAELDVLTSLARQYTDLIKSNSTSSAGFMSKCGKIRMETASKIPSIMSKKAKNIAEDLEKKLMNQAPKLMTKKEIEAYITKKYGNSMSEEQIKKLATILFENCNEITVESNGEVYKVTIDSEGNYIVNDVKKDKVSFEKIFGSVKPKGEVKGLNVNTSTKFLSFSSMDGKKETKYGNSDFGKISASGKLGVEIIMAEFVQNGVPLITTSDGKIEMLKNTNAKILASYAEASGSVSLKSMNSIGLQGKIKVGVDAVTISSDIISAEIPTTNKNLVIKGEGGVGVSFEMSGNLSSKEVSGKIKAGAGPSAGLKVSVVDQDYLTEKKSDFDF